MKGNSFNRSTGGTDRRALVQWLSGTDAGSFTADLQLQWIRDFDETQDFRDESHVVEWRVPPRPRAGWPLIDAKVLEVSDDMDFLKRRMLEEEKKADRQSKSETGEREQMDRLKSPNLTSTPIRSRLDVNMGSEDVRKLFQTFLDGIGIAATKSPSPEDENQVKVGEVLTISKTTHMEAKLARTPTSMTMELVRASFSKGRLRKSSYAGQKRERNGLLLQKPSLKKYRKMKDIQNFVNQRFPYFSQSAFGHAVNACVGKNVDKRPARQLVDESASEESD